MPMYLGRDGQFYDHAVPGATRLDTGHVNPPPSPRNTGGAYPHPPHNEAGFFRKALFWFFSMGASVSGGYAMGELLRTDVLGDISSGGFIGGLSNMFATGAPPMMAILAAVFCLVFGISAGESNNYNLVALIFTLLSTGGICLVGALVLVLIPYGLALIGYLFVGALIIGLIASLFGG